MTTDEGNKHATRSARTRERFIRAALKLYANRSIDAVSLNEVTAAAGQKNRNALQYHFGNKAGLLQAIVDQHSAQVAGLRSRYCSDTALGSLSAQEAAARALVTPVTQYLEQSPEGIYYVKLLSQLSSINQAVSKPGEPSQLSPGEHPELGELFKLALSHLGNTEAQQRLFLVISMTFHGIADICRISEDAQTGQALAQREPMFEQLIVAIAALLQAPPRS